MRGLQITPEGLQAWSTQCETAATELATRAPDASGLPSGQATAAAVTASQTITTAAAQVLAARVQATGKQAGIAAGSYADNDDQSAERLAALAPDAAVVI